MMTKKQTASLKPNPNQPRKEFDEAELRSLGESMKALGQIQPVGARPDGTLLWGERRWRAAQLAGITELQVIITDREMTESEILLIQLTENMQRTDLSNNEKFLAVEEYKRLNPSWQLKDLAAHLKLDPSTLTRIQSPARCTPAWREALAAGKVGLSDCYAASLVSEAGEQDAMLKLKLAGATRDELARVSRQKRKSTESTVRLSRVKIAMPQGVTVVLTGQELTMSDVVDLLGETLKEARKAAEQYDVKTFQSMMRDRAKVAR